MSSTVLALSLVALPLASGAGGGLIPGLPNRAERRSTFLSSQAQAELKREVENESRTSPAQKSPPGSPVVAAFYSPTQEGALSSFNKNAKHLTHVMPQWLRLGRQPGQLNTADFSPKLPSPNPQFVDIARREGVRVWPVLSNRDKNGMYDGKAVSQLLRSPQAQSALAVEIRHWLNNKGFDGLTLDFEGLGATDRARVPAFLAQLKSTLRSSNLGLSVATRTESDALTIQKLAGNVDLLIVKVYGEHSQRSAAGPIASIDWTEGVLDEFSAAVPANKLIVGIGSYALDWRWGGSAGKRLSSQAAFQLAAQNTPGKPASEVLTFDRNSLNVHFRYLDATQGSHDVWFLDGVAAFNQWKLAQELSARGSILCELGTEDASIWRFLNKEAISEAPDAGALTVVEPGPANIEAIGSGDLLAVTGQTKAIARDVKVDNTSRLVYETSYHDYPTRPLIDRNGKVSSKMVALTFEDGPDPKNSPAILDALKELQVPATFFVVGRNAEANPDLLRRMYAEGHEIGNHTYLHPNLSLVTDRRAELEIKATQDAIESILGRSTNLFRPSYHGTSMPTGPNDLTPLVAASRLGLTTVGKSIDPQDLRRGRQADGSGTRRTANELAMSVRYQLAQKGHGSVVLLHDGFGDRNTMIEALKLLVPDLRARGYEFVPVSTLVGRSRDAVMPPVAVQSRALTSVNNAAFSALFAIECLLRLAFLIAVGLGLTSLVWQTAQALAHSRRSFAFSPTFRPTTSVLIAACDEEGRIARTIQSILASDCRIDEVIVVDDGSHDETFLEVVTQFAGEPRVIVLRQQHSGEATALNRALSQARGEVVVTVGAGAEVGRDTIRRLVRRFESREVGVVTGNSKPRQQQGLSGRFAEIERLTNPVADVSLAAWRKAALIEAGGFAHASDLPSRLQRAGWQLDVDSAAVARVDGTAAAGPFWGQQTSISKLASLNLLHRTFMVISPVLDLQLMYAAAMLLVAWGSGGALGEAQRTLVQVSFLYGLFFVAELVAASVICRLRQEPVQSLWWLFLQRLVSRQLLYVAAYRTLFRMRQVRSERDGLLAAGFEASDVREKASLK